MRSVSSDQSCQGNCVSAEELIGIFYKDSGELGTFRRVASDVLPEVYRRLLSHANHMTVTVEEHHGDEVDVEVLRSDTESHRYRREILLRTHRANRVVQYGIVRLNTNYLEESPRNEILAQKKPLGRVLIEHNVMREIELFDLFEVTTVTYGRTALLYCNQDPAIELLEVVAPE
jgi:chorismate-pyruvate lyase